MHEDAHLNEVFFMLVVPLVAKRSLNFNQWWAII